MKFHMAKSAAASATGISNTLTFAAEVHSALFTKLNALEQREAGGLQEQLADLHTSLTKAIDDGTAKGDLTKLSVKHSESDSSDGSKYKYTDSISVSGQNLPNSAFGHTRWNDVSRQQEQNSSHKAGSITETNSLKQSFAAKLQNYRPDTDSHYNISEFSGSRFSKFTEKDTSKKSSESATQNSSFSFKGLYQSGASNRGTADHIKINHFSTQDSITATDVRFINEDADTVDTPFSFNASLQLNSQGFSFRATERAEDELVISNGSGTVDSLQFSLQDSLSAKNVSYSAVALNGAELATNDLADFAAALFAGNDKIIGTAGNDIIMGFAGNDTITGGLGADTLSGGVGKDTFVIGKADSTLHKTEGSFDAYDVITDFNTGDILKMGGKAVSGLNYTILNTTYDTLDDAASAAAEALGKRGYALAYVDDDLEDGVDGSSFLFHDVSGDGTADQMVELVGIAPMELSAAAII